MRKKLFALTLTVLMFLSICIPVSAKSVDELYIEAFQAVSECQKNKTQISVNKAREKINLLFKTGAEWAVGEFSKQVDQIQHPILVKIVDGISLNNKLPRQESINEIRNIIKDLPVVDWKNSYSSALDKCQQKLLNSLATAYEKLEKNKTQENKESCLNIIKELKISIDNNIINFAKSYEDKINNIIIVVQGDLKVHYIDVGQADSILIQQGKHSMLIDAGNNDDSTLVRDYIKKQGITTLDYVIGTHPHEDHIGGLDYVINAFNIGSIYMPKKTATTKTYKDVLSAIKAKGMGITEPKVGQTLQLGEAKITILGPSKIYDDANNCSIVLRLDFGANSFLFTGDAEEIAEKDMINANLNLKADVLKVGHHGSYTSSSSEFLNKVNPQYAVISVGKDNQYGHPHENILNRYKSLGCKIYRTDLNGTIIITSNGKEIKCITEKVENNNSNTKLTYIGNTKTKKYHLDTCRSLPDLENRTYFNTKEEAQAAGYVPCKLCNP